MRLFIRPIIGFNICDTSNGVSPHWILRIYPSHWIKSKFIFISAFTASLFTFILLLIHLTFCCIVIFNSTRPLCRVRWSFCILGGVYDRLNDLELAAVDSADLDAFFWWYWWVIAITCLCGISWFLWCWWWRMAIIVCICRCWSWFGCCRW